MSQNVHLGQNAKQKKHYLITKIEKGISIVDCRCPVHDARSNISFATLNTSEVQPHPKYRYSRPPCFAPLPFILALLFEKNDLPSYEIVTVSNIHF